MLNCKDDNQTCLGGTFDCIKSIIIKHAFMAIYGSGGTKWLDLSGSRSDLGGTHPGWSVGDIWTHQNCHRGALVGSELAWKCHRSGISGHNGPRWLDISGSVEQDP